MGNNCKKILSYCLAFSFLFCMLPKVTAADAVAYENTYVNTGDQRADILGVALTQLGFREGPENDTKYGTWYGLPNQPWCATFISWCAEVADVPAQVLTRTGRAHPGYFELSYQDGSNYTPQPGDLFFTKAFTHVGFVYQVDGEYFHTIEGNANNDGSDNGIGIFCNQRRIADYYFSSPEYLGGDKDHSYILLSESTHPHKTYYQCTTCGDRHDTGKTTFLGSCSHCTACGCTAELAGTYIFITTDTKLRIRSGHSVDDKTVGYIPSGGKVQVLAAAPDGWAHVQYEAYRGYVSMEYLMAIPETPVISFSTETLYKGDCATITWSAAAGAERYQLALYQNGHQLICQNLEDALSYTAQNLQPGSYRIQLSAVNQAGSSEAATADFQVLDTYPVTYDLRDGADGPSAQTKLQGTPLTLSDDIPSRTGFMFLGWADSPDSLYALYQPGDTLHADAPLTLYAVWKAADAVPLTLEIDTLPVRTTFVVGEFLDTAGLVLKLTYSDGSSLPVSTGFTSSELSSQQPGTETVTVTYGGLEATYPVQIVAYIPGDLTGDRFVNRDDVMWLLWHLSFPEDYPVTIPTDYTGDSHTNRDDVMWLLWHLSFPEQYPLEVSE